MGIAMTVMITAIACLVLLLLSSELFFVFQIV
jgi:hypothetical protein